MLLCQRIVFVYWNGNVRKWAWPSGNKQQVANESKLMCLSMRVVVVVVVVLDFLVLNTTTLAHEAQSAQENHTNLTHKPSLLLIVKPPILSNGLSVAG